MGSLDDMVLEFKDGGLGSERIDPSTEKKLVRKLDLNILPWVLLLYLFSFLDRVNIGNAKLYGIQEDLGLDSAKYTTAVAILFVTYITSELPSNIILKKAKPSRWLSFIAVSWGIIATLTGLVQSYGGLIATRLLLGAFEGGLYPGMVVWLTMFYPRKEIATRQFYLFVSAALAGACGGLLAYAIGHMDGICGLRAWRWLMILEGIPCVVLGVGAWFGMANSPSSAWFLTADERRMAVSRLTQEIGVTTSGQELHKSDVLAAFKDWKVWMLCFSQSGIDTVLYGYSTYLPTIIKGIRPQSSSVVIQALTIPCYAVGAITYLMVAVISDRQQRRGLYAGTLILATIVGYAILISDASSGAHYFGCFLVAMGLYTGAGLGTAWLASNSPRFGKRTTAVGLNLTIGNCAGIWAPFLYPDDLAPRYIMGHSVSLAMAAFSSVIFYFMWWYFALENKKRQRGERDGRIANMSEEEIDELGDESPRFVFCK